MSVPVGLRSESRVEFINVTMQLDIHTKQCCRKLPKSAMFIMTKNIIDMVNEIGKNVVIANSRYPKTIEDINFRKSHFTEARGLLDWLDFQVQQCYEMYRGKSKSDNPSGDKVKISDFGWREWGRLIYTLKGLLTSIINSDKDRISK